MSTLLPVTNVVGFSKYFSLNHSYLCLKWCQMQQDCIREKGCEFKITYITKKELEAEKPLYIFHFRFDFGSAPGRLQRGSLTSVGLQQHHDPLFHDPQSAVDLQISYPALMLSLEAGVNLMPESGRAVGNQLIGDGWCGVCVYDAFAWDQSLACKIVSYQIPCMVCCV